MPTDKAIHRQLRELTQMAHDRELGLYLSELESRFRQWREGEIGPSELSDLIHEFHEGAARAVHRTYTNLNEEQSVARAIGIGLLRQGEVPEEVRQRLSSSIDFYREHYQIDEDDPLAKLRA